MTHTQPAASAHAPQLKTLSGVLERITYQNEETGYTVARLLPDRRAEGHSARDDDGPLVTVVGPMSGVVVGEALELTGVWKSHPQHGWQFTVENYRSVLPATEQGIRKYLGSGLIKGIGPRTAEKIVARFGDRTLHVLEESPERLRETPGLGPHRARLIAHAWAQQKAIKEVMLFLQGHDVSTSVAVRIYKQYGDASITVVKNDPYRLARDVWGVGFKTADKIARALGFAPDHPERLKACALFTLSEASDSGGHTYLPRPELARQAAEVLDAPSERIEEAIDALALDGGLRVETLVGAEDVGDAEARGLRERSAEYRPAGGTLPSAPRAGNGAARGFTQPPPDALGERRPTPDRLVEEDGGAPPAVYLPPFHTAEQGVAQHLRRLARRPPSRDSLAELARADHDRMFRYLAEKEGLRLSDRQREGVVMALTEPVAVLTGGPGTGKTTSMRALIRALVLKGKRVVLAAPTGRAAKRLSEATGLEAKTLHRLLQLRPGFGAQ
jgi:exodeoxyribonuclease V alpha subunit